MTADSISVWRIFCDRELSPTALKTAAVVGTLLLSINHGASIWEGTMTRERWFAAGFTYLVPYSVSIHGQYMSRQRNRRAKARTSAQWP